MLCHHIRLRHVRRKSAPSRQACSELHDMVVQHELMDIKQYSINLDSSELCYKPVWYSIPMTLTGIPVVPGDDNGHRAATDLSLTRCGPKLYVQRRHTQ